MNAFLFEELGFHGSRTDYYNRSNSYMNEVIDDREGLPITLSVLYLELARRLDLNVAGIGLPGHFVVRFEPSGESKAGQLIDVFDGGKPMTRDQAVERAVASTGRPFQEKAALVGRRVHDGIQQGIYQRSFSRQTWVFHSGQPSGQTKPAPTTQ